MFVSESGNFIWEVKLGALGEEGVDVIYVGLIFNKMNSATILGSLHKVEHLRTVIFVQLLNRILDFDGLQRMTWEDKSLLEEMDIKESNKFGR